MKKLFKGKTDSILGPLLAILVVGALLAITSNRFLTFSNLMNVLRQTAINALLSIGMLFVMLTGGIDLSVGSMTAVSACLMGIMLKAGISNPAMLMLVALLSGSAVGLINGLLYTKLRLPHPFVSTMGMMQILRGFALLITQATPISGFPAAVLFLGFNSIGKFPICFAAVIVIAILSGVFLSKTSLGRYIYSVGGNREAARLSGIKVDRTICFTYVMSGLLAAFAGIVLVGRVGTAFPLAGDGYEMDAVAACVIGGASFNGGRGTAIGTLFGAMFIAILNNGLNLLGATSDVQQMAIGAVIIIAVLIDVLRSRAEAASRVAAQEKLYLQKS